MNNLEDFVGKFEDFAKWDTRKQIDYITYYLTGANGGSCSAKEINNCFVELSIKPYKRLAQYLSENASDGNGKYVKGKTGGYRLERRMQDDIRNEVENEPVKIQVSNQLKDLIQKIKNTNEKLFLIEAINCYKVEAFRASIVLLWILGIDHLQNYIFGNKLDEFNIALSKNPDKKMSKIVNYDDFSELKESKFIELAKSAGIISNDIRKILDEKLGIRNSASHPSGIVFSGHKTTEFALDIVNNIVLKY